MKKSELKQMIKEEIRRLISEDYLSGIFENNAIKELKKQLSNSDYQKLEKEVERVDKIVDDNEGLWAKIERLDGYFPIDYAKDALEYLKQYAKVANDRKLSSLVDELIKKYKF